jgi:hypothetical protein
MRVIGADEAGAGFKKASNHILIMEYKVSMAVSMATAVTR